jgi:DNA-binding response OmpR family regulator
MTRLLTIADKPSQLAFLKKRFEAEGFEVVSAQTGVEGQMLCSSSAPDAVVLDMAMSDVDPVQFLKNIRRNAVSIPVVMLSERGDVDQRVTALQEGANDYLMKPFKFPDLMERIVTLLRRHSFAPVTSLSFDDEVTINLLTRTVIVNGDEFSLTTRPFSVLVHLVKHQGQIVSREELAQEIWHDESIVGKNVIEVHINHIRSDFHQRGYTLPLLSIRGQGYMLKNKCV